MNPPLARTVAIATYLLTALAGGILNNALANDGLKLDRFLTNSTTERVEARETELRENRRVMLNPLRDSVASATISGPSATIRELPSAARSIARIQLPNVTPIQGNGASVAIVRPSLSVPAANANSELNSAAKSNSLFSSGYVETIQTVRFVMNQLSEISFNPNLADWIDLPSDPTEQIVNEGHESRFKTPSIRATTASWKQAVEEPSDPAAASQAKPLQRLSCQNMMVHTFEATDFPTLANLREPQCMINDAQAGPSSFWPSTFPLSNRILIEESLPQDLQPNDSRSTSFGERRPIVIRDPVPVIPAKNTVNVEPFGSTWVGAWRSIKTVSLRILDQIRPWLELCDLMDWQHRIESILMELDGVFWSYPIYRSWANSDSLQDSLPAFDGWKCLLQSK